MILLANLFGENRPSADPYAGFLEAACTVAFFIPAARRVQRPNFHH